MLPSTLRRARRSLVLIALSLAAAGCGDDSAPALDAGPPDAGARDAGPRDAGPPPIDPSLFDCTSDEVRHGALLPRTSLVPLACALDPACRTPQVAGHRGAGGQLGTNAPEDTLAAYRAGIALGIEYLETDPRPTSDGVLVNMHDPTVNRTTDGIGDVSAMTFEQVRALHIVTSIPGDYGCEQVPTLQEILTVAKGRAVVLVDANKTDRVDLLVQAILDADAIDTAVFDTSDVAKIDAALAIEPTLHIMIRPATADIEAQLDHFAPLMPTLVELDPADVAAGVPIVHARGGRAFSDVFGADVVYGIRGDTSGYEDALDLGLDVLQCDHPEAVVRLMQARGVR